MNSSKRSGVALDNFPDHAVYVVHDHELDPGVVARAKAAPLTIVSLSVYNHDSLDLDHLCQIIDHRYSHEKPTLAVGATD